MSIPACRVDWRVYIPSTRLTTVINASSIVSPLAAFARQLALGPSATIGAAIAIATTEIAITTSAHSCTRVIESFMASPGVSSVLTTEDARRLPHFHERHPPSIAPITTNTTVRKPPFTST